MEKDKEFYGDLDSFLQSIGLENYKRLFTNNEIEDEQTMLRKSLDDFTEMRIP